MRNHFGKTPFTPYVRPANENNGASFSNPSAPYEGDPYANALYPDTNGEMGDTRFYRQEDVNAQEAPYDAAYEAAENEIPVDEEAAYTDPYGYYGYDADMPNADDGAYVNPCAAPEYSQDYVPYEPYDSGAEEAFAKPAKRTIFKPRSRKPSFILTVIVNSLRLLMLLVLILGLSGVGTVVGIARAYVDTAPNLDLAAIDDQAQTSFIYDAKGNLITEYKGTENRVMVSIDEMPQMLRHAFVAVEDARFYTHSGVDLKRIVGSFITNYLTGSQQGGSTITQQLIKNTVLTNERSYKRKIQEAYLALQLESRYSKDQVLESYLNTIYLGEDYYGVKVAAYGYFGRENLNDLTLRECAMLAGTCNSPYYYNPRRNYFTRESAETDYAAITDNRTDYVLRCMYENQFITREQYEQALNPASANVLRESPESKELYPYPHYVEYAVREAVQILLKLNGLENTSQNRNKMESELRTGGYKVFLALDTEIQTIVENTLYNYKSYPALRDPGDNVYRARNSDGTYDEIPQPQAAAVVMDYRTGEVKAIVGSRTRPTQRKTLNRATDMNMPVGSSIKPIAVYAPAIELGAGGGTILYNMPLPITGWRGSDGKDTWPKNYGGSSYRGPETLRKALTKSDNTAAAYALMNFVGVERASDFLLRMGVSNDRINRTPFGVALGSSGITPFEMTAAFSTLGNGGVYQEPITVLGIFDPDLSPIYDAHQQQERRQVFKPSTAYLTVDILKDAASSSGTGSAARIKGQTVAGKTGTNSDQKGVFFSGLTGWYAGSVWIGHDNYKALSSKTTGGNSAAKLWQAFMSEIHNQKGLGDRDIMEGDPSDYGLVKVTTCAVSGQRATDACKLDLMDYGTVTDYWPKDTAPNTYCQMHVNATVCSASGMLASNNCPATQRSNRSITVIPQGHPLYQFIGTSYQGVLTDYLGESASVRLTSDANTNAALLGGKSCTLHQNGQTLQQNTANALLQDAQTLLSSARLLLSTVSPDHWAYSPLADAIRNLENVAASSPDVNTLATAMTMLTQAMANVQ